MQLAKMSNNLDISALNDGRFSVYNKRSKKTYVIGAAECSVLQNLDGNKSLKELENHLSIPEESLEKLIRIFDNIGLLDGSEVKARNKITRITLGVLNPNKILATDGLAVRIMSSILLYLTLPLLIVAIYVSVKHPGLVVELQEYITTPLGFSLIPIVIIVTMMHEFSHVVMAKRYGANVPEMGFVLYWFMPAMYVNLSCVNLIDKKWQRILAFSAGIFCNCIILSIALLIRPFFDFDARVIISGIFAGNLFTIILNLFIFLKYDGYLIIKEMFDQPYLRERSLQYFRHSLAKFLRRFKNSDMQFYIEAKDINEPSPSERNLYFSYAIFSILYIPALIVMLVMSVIRIFI